MKRNIASQKKIMRRGLLTRLQPSKVSVSSYYNFSSKKNRLSNLRNFLNIKSILDKISHKKKSKEFSIEKYAFHLSKHDLFFPKKLVFSSSHLTFQLINPLATVLELKQLIYLINQLVRFKNHKLFVFIQNSQLRKLFETLLKYFPYLSNKVSIERASTMQQIDPRYTQSVHGLVLFLGDVPEFVQKFFISKNFIIINALNLNMSYNLEHYKLTGDVRNVKGVTWLLSFLNAVYKRSKENYSRMTLFCRRRKNVSDVINAIRVQKNFSYGERKTDLLISKKYFEKTNVKTVRDSKYGYKLNSDNSFSIETKQQKYNKRNK